MSALGFKDDKADRKRINSISIVPDSMDFVSAGISDHLYYWTVANGRMKSKKISVPGATGKTRLYFTNVKHAASKACFASCSDGNVYTLQGNAVSGKPTPCHSKPI